MKKKKRNQKETVFGIAWFKEEDWGRLLEISDDRAKLESTYSEWLLHAEKVIKNFEKQGVKIQRVNVTPNQLLIWCKERNIPVNGEARSGYASHKMQQQAEKGA